MLYIIIWNDNYDNTVTRLYKLIQFYEVGYINGYGWQVITIQELYETSFYRKETILIMIESKTRTIYFRNSLIKKIIKAIDIALS